MKAAFWLPKHVYMCCPDNDTAVFLDIRRDDYSALTGSQASALSSVVEGWPTATTQTTLSNDQSMQTGALMVRAGLLTDDPKSGKPVETPRIPHDATLRAIEQDFESAKAIRPIDVARFLWAYASTLYALKCRSLEHAVKRFSSRKSRRATDDAAFVPHRAAELVRVFRRLRCFVFTANGQCLFHSLFLLNFLACYRLYPTWVIGVKAKPFAAHSWVQHDTYMLDANPEEVVPYVPLFAI